MRSRIFKLRCRCGDCNFHGTYYAATKDKQTEVVHTEDQYFMFYVQSVGQ
jgi:hypothetical protein